MLIFNNNFIMTALGLYSDIRPASFKQTLWKLFLSVVMLFLTLIAALYFLNIGFIDRSFILVFMGMIFILNSLERLLIDFYIENMQHTSFNARQLLLVGNDRRAYQTFQGLNKQRSWGHQFIGYLEVNPTDFIMPELPSLGCISDLKDVICERNVDEVIFALPPRSSEIKLKDYIDVCEQTGVSYRIVPSMYNPDMARDILVETIQGIPTLTRNTVRINPSGMLYKRGIDCLVGLMGFGLFCLMFPFIAVAIKFDSSGPVLFRQPRVGQNGRIFTMYKFRTMVQDAEQLKKKLEKQNLMGGMMFKVENDPRITPSGHFLRKLSLDEFPQFINVLKGEMSIVGTRPPTIDEVKKYEIQHRRRISIKPGITGLWQVSGRNKITDFEEVVRLDLEYIDKWTFWRDLEIILKTIWVVLARKGAL
jgi:exopolysaccharide biosynthesis polyprenyl glycosylphosphotransferase